MKCFVFKFCVFTKCHLRLCLRILCYCLSNITESLYGISTIRSWLNISLTLSYSITKNNFRSITRNIVTAFSETMLPHYNKHCCSITTNIVIALPQTLLQRYQNYCCLIILLCNSVSCFSVMLFNCVMF